MGDLKYLVFALFALVTVPAMAALAWWSEKARGWLFSLLIFATCLGDHGNINFLSTETYRGPDRGFEVTLADLVCWALAMAVVARKPSRIAWIPYNTGLMVLFFGMALVSTLDAPQGVLSAFTLVKMLRGYAMYWTVVNVVRVGVPLKSVWRGILAVGITFAFYAVYQKYGQGLYRINATFDHSNTVPLFLNQVMPVLLVMGLAARWLPTGASMLSLGTVVAMLLVDVMTFSRAGMVFALLVVLGVLLVANRKTRTIRVQAASIVVVGSLVLGGLVTGKSIVERFLEAPEASHMAREEFNQAALAMARDNTLGVGINQFSYVLTNTPAYTSLIKVMANEKQKGVCHEVYLLTAAEMGWLGLASFALVLLRFLWKAAFEAFRRRGFDGLVQAGLAFGMAALHLSGFLEWVFRITPIFFLYLICSGLSVGLAGALPRKGGAPRGGVRKAAEADGEEAEHPGGLPEAESKDAAGVPGPAGQGDGDGSGGTGRKPQVTGDWVPVREPPAGAVLAWGGA